MDQPVDRKEWNGGDETKQTKKIYKNDQQTTGSSCLGDGWGGGGSLLFCTPSLIMT